MRSFAVELVYLAISMSVPKQDNFIMIGIDSAPTLGKSFASRSGLSTMSIQVDKFVSSGVSLANFSSSIASRELKS